ncbi:MAG: signal peptidase I [Erysipelotrichaceae bacterium]
MKNIVKELFSTVISSFIFVMLIVNFIFSPVHIDGHSMDPTLSDGSYGIAGIINRFFGLERFDIVTIELDNHDYIIKRIIGLPNETIEVIDNHLYIDGIYYEESFLANDTITNDFKIILGEDEYFVMGDNRQNSSDSRYYGPFESKQIKTRGVFIILG